MKLYKFIEDKTLLKMTREELVKLIRDRERQLDIVEAQRTGTNIYLQMIEDDI